MNKKNVLWLVIGVCGAGLTVVAFVAFVGLVLGNVYLTQIVVAGSDIAEKEYPGPQGAVSEKQWRRTDRLLERYPVDGTSRRWSAQLYDRENFGGTEDLLAGGLAKIGTEKGALDYSSMAEALGRLGYDDDPEQHDAVLARWAEAHPESHFPWLIRGKFLKVYAWYWRGTGWGRDVHPVNARKQQSALKEARECLERAYELNPGDPESSSELVAIATGMGLDRDEMEYYYDNAIEACPHHYGARSRKLYYLMPKWHGTKKLMLDFVEECDGMMDEFPFLGLIRVGAYEEFHYYDEEDKDMLKRDEIWNEVKSRYRTAMDRYPEYTWLHSDLARTAHMALRYIEASEQLDLFGDSWSTRSAWSSIRAYHRARISIYASGGQLEAGERGLNWCLKAIELAPKRAYAHQQYGMYLLRNNRVFEAEAPLVRAYELNPSLTWTTLCLSYTYGEQGRFEEAIQFAKDTIDRAKKTGLIERAEKYIEVYGELMASRGSLPKRPYASLPMD